jgi:hypothetical protein
MTMTASRRAIVAGRCADVPDGGGYNRVLGDEDQAHKRET